VALLPGSIAPVKEQARKIEKKKEMLKEYAKEL